MAKLVILKLAGNGNLEQGFSVTLQIGEDGRSPSLEITGRLPSAPEIPQCYSDWARAYRQLGLRGRLEASRVQVTNVSKNEMCFYAAQELGERLNTWLNSECFRSLREKLLEKLIPGEEIRLIIQTENIWLRRLPWHLWDLCNRYPKLEIALSAPEYDSVEAIEQPSPRVKILAILGNSVGINTQADRLLLENLPEAEVKFLVEPQRQELTDELWRQGWDLLFFAGHSSSQGNDEIGRIYINKTDSLTVDQLKYALKRAALRGLKIAIFNSCDGLGLARNLADLQIPQIVVMREPVPDKVAQEFLKYFLEGFAKGESFYLSVREARERLQGLEDKFPCATWLPIICQNPAVLPPSWRSLQERIEEKAASESSVDFLPTKITPVPTSLGERLRAKIFGGRRGLGKVFLLSLMTTFSLLVVRQVGMLQPLELHAFDHLMGMRPAEPRDNRILVIGITQQDIQAQKPKLRPGTSLSDSSLAKLLEILESYQVRAIGLDIYRDFPVQEEYQDLRERLRTSDRFFAVCKVSNPKFNDIGIEPPPELSKNNLGFADVVIDPDGVVRRHLLAMSTPPTSPCTASWALSSKLAFRYLEEEGISRQFTKDRHLQLGQTIFKPLDAQTGGYQNIDHWGYQILLNYRFYRSPESVVHQVNLSDVLEGQLDPDAVKDKIVLIGVTAATTNDYFLTPYSRGQRFQEKIPGVVVHAQMVSQLLGAVLDRRPLLWAWSELGEVIWIWSWSLVGGILFWRFNLWSRLGLVLIASGMLYGLCLTLMLQGGWVPLVTPVLALLVTGGGVTTYGAFSSSRKSSILALKL